MDEKHDLETEEMWSDIESVESKMTPRLRAEEVGVMMNTTILASRCCRGINVVVLSERFDSRIRYGANYI